MKQLLHSGPGIVIGIPTLGRPVPLDWAFAFKSINPPSNFNSIYQVVNGCAVADARNIIANLAIEKDAKYLFFIGDDVVAPPHTLRSLIYRMEQNSEIGVVGGVYCVKATPSDPLVYRGNGSGSYWDWKIGEFFEVTGLGMDCTLIRVAALKAIGPKDWFKTVDGDKFLDGINSAESWTEDLWFFKELKEKTDYKVYCDGGVICDHWDVYANKKYGLPPDSLPMRQMVVKKDRKALHCGSNLLTDPNVDVVNFSADNDAADYRGTYDCLPFAENEFEIVQSDLTNELSPIVLKEYSRVLKSGGKIVLTFSDWLNSLKIREILVELGFEIVSTDKCLIEGIKK